MKREAANAQQSLKSKQDFGCYSLRSDHSSSGSRCYFLRVLFFTSFALQFLTPQWMAVISLLLQNDLIWFFISWKLTRVTYIGLVRCEKKQTHTQSLEIKFVSTFWFSIKLKHCLHTFNSKIPLLRFTMPAILFSRFDIDVCQAGELSACLYSAIVRCSVWRRARRMGCVMSHDAHSCV